MEISNQMYHNFIQALANRDSVYLALLLIAVLAIAGYYAAHHLPTPSPIYKRLIVAGYWLIVGLTYVSLIAVTFLA